MGDNWCSTQSVSGTSFLRTSLCTSLQVAKDCMLMCICTKRNSLHASHSLQSSISGGTVLCAAAFTIGKSICVCVCVCVCVCERLHSCLCTSVTGCQQVNPNKSSHLMIRGLMQQSDQYRDGERDEPRAAGSSDLNCFWLRQSGLRRTLRSSGRNGVGAAVYFNFWRANRLPYHCVRGELIGNSQTQALKWSEPY